MIQLFCASAYADSDQDKVDVSNTAQDNEIKISENDMKDNKKNPHLLMKVKNGDVLIELYPDKAPNHVTRILELTKKGFYNDLKFHRVIEDFMVQTGDPKGNGTGGSDLPDLKAEFNDIKHVKGVMSMARSASPDSANSQFFIMLGDSPHLDGQYTAFGRVISGMEFIDQIKKGNINNNGMVTSPDSIVSLSEVIE